MNSMLAGNIWSLTSVYDPNSDHRRKGVFKKDVDTLRTKHTTLQTLIQALLNYEEDDAFELVRQIRSCEDLETVAQSVAARQNGLLSASETRADASDENLSEVDQFDSELSGKIRELFLDGSRKFIGGTSNLIFLPPGSDMQESTSTADFALSTTQDTGPIGRWTRVTDDESLISHLLTMYFTWHYPFFTILAKDLFYRDFMRGVSSQYCSALLVNAMLALGCHFSAFSGACSDPENIATAGNHFFKEAKRLIHENDEHETAKLCTVQAFALMSVREAGCGREGKGWVYSGLSFRMAFDLGLNVDASNLGYKLSDEEIDARRITFWGCFVIDKCWSNYLGRQPQLLSSNTSIPKIELLPKEETEAWSPYTDAGIGQEHTQPSRTRAVALQISKLCEISNDLLLFFYNPSELEKSQSKQLELKRLSDVHTRLEAWKKELPRELDPKEGQLPQVLVMHMFHQLLHVHLYRPFLKYTKANTPLPPHVSPRKICTQAASVISKLLRMYKRTYGLKQICNIVVYIAHTACTIHLLNLPGRNPERDVVHCLRNLEEMADSWVAARRTLRILDISANKWQVKLPSDAITIFERTHAKWGSWGSWDQVTSPSASEDSPMPNDTYNPPYAYPGAYQPPTNQVPTGLHREVISPTPASIMEVSMGPHYPNATVSPMAPMGHIRQASGPITQRADYATAAPEPQYMRQIPQVNYQMAPLATSGPSAAASPVVPSAWYDQAGNPIGPSHASHTALSPTSDSPSSGLDTTEHLVEESHDWWNKNAAVALGIGGAENWGAAWGPNIPAQSPPLSYGNSGQLMSMSAHQSGSAGAENSPQVSGGIPGMPPAAENGTTGYDEQWK
ncbi:transcriptional regulator family: Fungal Specific TF [Penicillium angulare]|uniref:transcriptional regulator family: Fungal Specific TF n=1 Tax=Penicillium angulare TaxID=116970 RepID=UPI002542431C|nr:transcriptional regulator family: Fungal Specific TF [Penicillium angulare]KAJ5279418.1 transcriptional regulator family: Fungal Specific TF [Penicillium angulare]